MNKKIAIIAGVGVLLLALIFISSGPEDYRTVKIDNKLGQQLLDRANKDEDMAVKHLENLLRDCKKSGDGVCEDKLEDAREPLANKFIERRKQIIETYK